MDFEPCSAWEDQVLLKDDLQQTQCIGSLNWNSNGNNASLPFQSRQREAQRLKILVQYQQLQE